MTNMDAIRELMTATVSMHNAIGTIVGIHSGGKMNEYVLGTIEDLLNCTGRSLELLMDLSDADILSAFTGIDDPDVYRQDRMKTKAQLDEVRKFITNQRNMNEAIDQSSIKPITVQTHRVEKSAHCDAYVAIRYVFDRAISKAEFDEFCEHSGLFMISKDDVLPHQDYAVTWQLDDAGTIWEHRYVSRHKSDAAL